MAFKEGKFFAVVPAKPTDRFVVAILVVSGGISQKVLQPRSET